MSRHHTAVFGIFPNRMSAETCVTELLNAGFSNDDVSVLAPDHLTTKGMGTEKHTKAPESATAGATTGGVIGGGLGLLAGIGAIAIPGVGPFIAAGPIMATLAGLGAGAAAGGILGALAGLGIPEYEAKRYEGLVRDGGVLISAHCEVSSQIGMAKDILKQCGAKDISSTGEEAVKKAG